MALHTFILQPSADIHLIPGVDVQVNVMGYDNAVSVTNPINAQCSFTMASTSIASISAGGLIHALTAGITFLTVEHAASGNKMVARIWCHEELENMFLGNNSGSVNVGSDNFQPTVFGIFDVMDIEDISGHPFITYENLSPALFSVDMQTGRVRGIAPGSGSLRIKEAAGGTVVGTLPIKVNESLATARPLVERVTFKGAGKDKRNILFLAEGFASGEEAKFKQMARDVDQKMRTSTLHEPFHILADDYNTWMAFDASAESGVSFGPEPTQVLNHVLLFHIEDVKPATATHYSVFDLIDLVGLPIGADLDPAFDLAAAQAKWASLPGFVAANLEAGILTEWKLNTKAFQQMIVKDSVYGLMYGRRLGDNNATTNAVHADNHWYRDQRTPTSFFYKDSRRIGTDHFYHDSFAYYSTTPLLGTYWTDEFFAYLNSLKRKDAPAADPLHDIGQKWNLGGDDQALVIVIVNDEKQGGNYEATPNIFGAVSAGVIPGILLSSTDSNAITGHIPNTASYLLPSLVSRVLHELSHGVFLGDEYDDVRDSGHAVPGASDIDRIEMHHNINTQARINTNGLKWAKMFRFSKSSALLSQAVINAGTLSVQVDLFPGEAAKWAMGEALLMATKNINVEADVNYYQSYNRHRSFAVGPLTISVIAGDTLTMTGLTAAPPADVVFPKGSFIFLPIVHNGSPLLLTLPGVIAWMNNGTGNLPGGTNPRVARFLSDKGGHCAQSDGTLPNTPHPIANVNIPFHDRHWLIGTHEGAGTYNCGVVRPAAVCKMRREYWYNAAGRGHFRFCHVCRFYLVQEFNASRHADLDRLYPGTPT